MADLPNEWANRSVESICERVTSGGTPSRRRPDFYTNGTIDWYKTGELRDRLLFGSEEKITQDALDNSSAKLFPINTVLLALYGDGDTITTLGLLKKPGATNQACCAMIVDQKLADARFLFYALKHTRLDLLQRCVGGAQRNLSGKLVREHQIPIPPLKEQKAIADVLGSLDDKIEQNRRTGAKLEELARAVFKAWFVDFEPVKAKAAGATAFPGMPPETFAALPTRFTNSPLGPVPQGWEDCWHRISDLERGGTLLIGDGYRAKRSELSETGAPFIRAGNVNGSIITNGAELLGKPAIEKAGVKRSQVWDTVFTSKGTVGRIGLVTPTTGDVVYAPQVCFWRAMNREALSPFHLHLWMKSKSFTCQWRSVKGQTDMADFVSLSDQRAMTMLVPPPEVQRGFETIAGPIIELIAASAAESAKLAALRDYLLPRLLSGRVRVYSEIPYTNYI